MPMIRRGTLTINGSGKTGVRDFSWEPGITTNRERADDEDAGDIVKESQEISGSFEMKASGLSSGYFTTLVFAFKEITITAGAEVPSTKTVTFNNGYLKVGGNVPTEGAGKIPVTFEAKSMTGPV